MRITELKTRQAFEFQDLKQLGIVAWGANNDYPQRVLEAVSASTTGASCVSVYSNFIEGQGFTNLDLSLLEIDSDGNTFDNLIEKISKDLAMFGGYSIKIDYNENGRVAMLRHLPFENIRLCISDENGSTTHVAEHGDWGRRDRNSKQIRKEDISFYEIFSGKNEQEIIFDIKEAGGVENYAGTVFYHTNSTGMTYPVPKFSSALVDMNTQEGLSNISNRNARNNFYPAGMMVLRRNGSSTEKQQESFKDVIKQVQTDENAGKILFMELDLAEGEGLTFENMSGKNYDKDFVVTDQAVKDRIGESLSIPPILRGVDIGSNFGSDLIKNSYDFYNSFTTKERYLLERNFVRIFGNAFNDFSLQPLSWKVERQLTIVELAKIEEIVSNTIYTLEKKEILLKLLGIEADKIELLLK